MVDSAHKTVCLTYDLDDAQSIVHLHNQQVTARAEWLDA